MRRYGYERYEKSYKSSRPIRREIRYMIFDRKGGCAVKLATVYDVADAEMICSALNYSIHKAEVSK